MNEYFFLTWSEEDEQTGVAYPPDGTKLAHELIDDLNDMNCLPFELHLRDGRVEDYLGNGLAWPMMSEPMKSVVQSNLTGKEDISWLSARVRVEDKTLPYFIPRFKAKLDVLDFQKTKFVRGTDQIIKACFAREKIKNYRMFPKPNIFWQITPSLYVDNFMKEQIQAAGLSGVAFEKATVA